MDNITHTLIGVALARAITPHGAPAPRRAAALWTAVLASNLADGDLIASAVLGGGKLTYLLHHRGWTHTVLALPVIAFVCAWVGRKIARVPREEMPSLAGRWRSEYGLLFGIGLAAAALHVATDFGNNYGVHPFSPFWNGWFFGDTIFIIEPSLWLALLPYATAGASAWARRAGLFLGLGILVLLWAGPFAPWPVALGLSVWGVSMYFAQRQAGDRLAPPAVACACVFAAFAWGGSVARGELRDAVPPGEHMLASMVRPAPSNPFCWEMLVATEVGGEYVVRSGGTSLAPGLFEPGECLLLKALGHTAPQSPNSIPDTPSLRWISEFRGPEVALRALGADGCHGQAAMHFLRFPFWTEQDGAHVLGDLRYDFQEELDFAEISVLPGEPCPRFVPAWNPPLVPSP